jgi:integrase
MAKLQKGESQRKITKRTVDAIRPLPHRESFVWDSGDGALKGFGVRMKPSGVGSYILQYRNSEGRTRRLTLGRIASLTPEQARALAKDKQHAIAHGADPSAERRAARKGITVAELCDRYLEEATAGKILGRHRRPIKASTLASDRLRIERHVKPLIGRRAVAGLSIVDIEDLQNDIAGGKTAKKRPRTGRTGVPSGGKHIASRTIGMLASIFQRYKISPVNPARGVRRFADNRAERYLKIDEIAALGQAAREAEVEGGSRTGIAAIRALILTGCRRNEILTLPWDWFDAKARCIRFDDTKVGPQIRPLGSAAVEFLSRQPRNGHWIFPSDRGAGCFVSIARVLADVCARVKLADVTPHTLRHTFGSIAAELGYSELTIAGLLGHAARGVTQRYSHLPDSTLIAAADRVSARIAAALDGKPEAEIVPLRARTAHA